MSIYPGENRMPTDFNKAADNNNAISQPIHASPSIPTDLPGENMPPEKEKPLTLRELLTMGLTQPDIDRVNLMRKTAFWRFPDKFHVRSQHAFGS